MSEPIFPPTRGYLFEAEVMRRAKEQWGADTLARLVRQHLIAGTLRSWKVDEAGQQSEIAAEAYRSDLQLRDALNYRPRGAWDVSYHS